MKFTINLGAFLYVNAGFCSARWDFQRTFPEGFELNKGNLRRFVNARKTWYELRRSTYSLGQFVNDVQYTFLIAYNIPLFSNDVIEDRFQKYMEDADGILFDEFYQYLEDRITGLLSKKIKPKAEGFRLEAE
jgi:hypothetical protein